MDLMCLPCIINFKQAGKSFTPDGGGDDPSEIRDAVTIASTELGPMTPICFECLHVQRQSSLLVPVAPGAVQMPG